MKYGVPPNNWDQQSIDEIYFNQTSGEFRATAATVQHIESIMRRVADSDDPSQHRQFAATILQPIREYSEYKEWLSDVLVSRPKELGEKITVAIKRPLMIATYTSPTGEVAYARPGRRVAEISMFHFNTGLQIGWWEGNNLAGWDVLQDKIREAGTELARKRDDVRKTVIDTAVAATSGHTSSVATTMTKAAVDAVFDSAAGVGFDIVKVKINSQTIRDMTSWAWPTDSMWNRLGPNRAEEVLKDGYVGQYGGAEWQQWLDCPASQVYFYAIPQEVGYEFPVTGGPKQKTASDIDTGVDKYRWDDFLGSYASGYGIWRLTIT